MNRTAHTPLTRQFSRWIQEEYRLPTGALGVFRIIYALYVLVIIGVPPFRWIGGKPDMFFNPPTYSMVYLFDGFPGPLFFWGLDVVVILMFVFVLFGYKTPWASWLLALGLFTGFSWSYAYGKINHDTLLIALVPLVMGFSGWGNRFSVDAHNGSSPGRERYWPITLLALLFGFAMFSAGLPKLLSGWLSPTTRAVQGYVIRQHYDYFADQMLTPFMLTFRNDFFWELMDYGAVFLEVGFLFAVARQTAFRFFIVIVMLFHLANCLIFNIEFSRNITLYLLFIDWRPIMQRFYQGTWDQYVQRYFTFRTFIIASIVSVAYYLTLYLSPVHLLLALPGWDELTRDTIVIGLLTVFFVVNFARSLLISQP